MPKNKIIRVRDRNILAKQSEQIKSVTGTDEKLNDLVQDYQNSMEEKNVNAGYSIMMIRDIFSGIFRDFFTVYIKAFVWSTVITPAGLVDFNQYFHASSVVKITNGRKIWYLSISHQDKGDAIIQTSSYFPFKKIGNYYLYRENCTRTIGKMVTNGKTKQLSVRVLGKIVYGWWYINDFMGGGIKSQFPASCTGLTETVLFFLRPQSNIIKDNRHGTGDISEALTSLQVQEGKMLLESKSSKRLTRAERAAVRAAKTSMRFSDTRRRKSRRRSVRRKSRRNSRRRSVRRKSQRRKSARRKSR